MYVCLSESSLGCSWREGCRHSFCQTRSYLIMVVFSLKLMLVWRGSLQQLMSCDLFRFILAFHFSIKPLNCSVVDVRYYTPLSSFQEADELVVSSAYENIFVSLLSPLGTLAVSRLITIGIVRSLAERQPVLEEPNLSHNVLF